MTITYHRDANGQMPDDAKASIKLALANIPQGQKVCFTITPAPPFADMDAADRIAAIVEWYNALPFDFADLDTLGNYSRLLACAIADLSALVGMLGKEANRCEYQRKRHFAERVQAIKAAAACSGAEAERQAEAEKEYQERRDDEQRANGENDAAKFILRHADGVLEVMRQQIAMLRREKENEQMGRGSQHA